MNAPAPTPATALPPRLAAVLGLAALFMIFLTLDQMHWWQLKPDYMFGWLVPVLIVYIIYDRWPKIGRLAAGEGARPLSPTLDTACTLFMSLALLGGAGIFLLGALYRGGSGPTQPGSLALALGFAGLLLGMIYFNAPRPAHGATDARLRLTALFLFPALIWILSAPLVTAVENAVSLFLLRKVMVVVFLIFSLLGLPIVQEGNVLVFPHSQVGVADACSGIRSLTGCLFAGSFLAAMFLDKFWKKFLLVTIALAFAFIMNLARSLFLAGWAYAYGSEAIAGALHDGTGFAVLGLTTLGLFAMLPLFNDSTWRRWLGVKPSRTKANLAPVPQKI
jgi:exosortase/archaeosortase family protein